MPTPPTDLAAAYDDALERFNGDNFSDLDDVDKVLVTIWGLEADVNNGGFDQYYFNSSGNQAVWAPAALRMIGAAQAADIVERANAVFGPEGPLPDRDARQDRLFQVAPRDDADDGLGPWDDLDDEFYGYPDDISELMQLFLRTRGRLA